MCFRRASPQPVQSRRKKIAFAKSDRLLANNQCNNYSMTNHSEIAEFLWKIADLIKDDYEAKDYKDVILPFTLLRRLDCVLEPTRDAVRKAAEKLSLCKWFEKHRMMPN